jgi:hypothetical protein
MLLLIVVGLLLVIAFLYTPAISKKEESQFVNIKETVHIYSGLHAEHFIAFINNIDLFERDIDSVHLAATYLYRAIGFLEELAMYGDADVQERIHRIIPIVGMTGERILMKKALEHNMAFRPTYLKNSY